MPEPTAGRDLPSLSLPKAGGAIRGLGEKASANPVTGTASLTVPVALTPGRGSIAPQLSLSYDSGAGNSPYGLGWSMDVSSVGRRTDRGVPQYGESDVFQLTGAEDLVPAMERRPDGKWVRVSRTDGEFVVEVYRPRTEGAFERIQRWRHRTTGDFHWRITGGDNVERIYGRDPAARVVDPQDPRRVFRWLLERVADDRGNVVEYEYKQEDAEGIDPAAPHERNRLRDGTAFAHRYLKRIRYGNQPTGGYLFEVVLDYGEHDESPDEVRPWALRADPFSTYRAGFEQRMYRLCRRVLMFHRIPELGDGPVLVRSTDLIHSQDPAITMLGSVVHRGYVRTGTTYRSKALPAVSFEYAERKVSANSQPFTSDQAEPQAKTYRWADVDGEGIAGVLAEQGGAWFYRANLGGGVIDGPRPVDPLPSTANLAAGQQLLDVTGDGVQALVDFKSATPGYYGRAGGEWADFAPFQSLPVLPYDDANLRFVDLTGDGLADVLLTADDGLTWYPSEGGSGFGEARQAGAEHDEERGPRLVFADAEQAVYLADLTGDGLTDLARIRNGEVAYWPNLGHGRFGAKVTMSAAPVFDSLDCFDQRRLRLADVDGSGPTDLLYVGTDSVRVWFNQAGNSWSTPEQVPAAFPADSAADIQVADALGKGTACLVIAESRPDGEPQLRLVDLMADGKPRMLRQLTNNRGLTTCFRYESSTTYYLADKAAGVPWLTRLPFPVLVVAEVTVEDSVAETAMVTTYTYRHGYYDGVDREFRGFGYVEQRDALSVDPETPAELWQPPAVIKRWQHTGWYQGRGAISKQFATEYWHGANDLLLPDTLLPTGLSADEEREACRVLRGTLLRQEICAADGSPLEQVPYQVSESSYRVRMLQPRVNDREAVFQTIPDQTLTIHTERTAADPRISHALTLEVDAWGNVTRSAAVSYGRRNGADPEQLKTWVTCSEREVVNQVEPIGPRRIGVLVGERSYEVGGVATPALFDPQWLNSAIEGCAEIPYQEEFTGRPERRLLADSIQTYYSDDLTVELPEGEVGRRALPYRSYRQALAEGQLEKLYEDRVTSDLITEAGYLKPTGKQGWWAPSGRQVLDPEHFYLPVAAVDPLGAITAIGYDEHHLSPVRIEDPAENVVRAELDYRLIQPWVVIDANDNKSLVGFDELGYVIATVVQGKDGEGDTLAAPTTWLEYDLTAVPSVFRTYAREEHKGTRFVESRTYSDGTGRGILTKVQAEPGEDGTARWVGTGRTVYDNKGQPVKQYEPYFAPDAEFDTENELVRSGVTSVLRYDPLGRLVRTELPDGTFTKIVFDCWEQENWDAGDTVLDSRWYVEHRGTREARLSAAYAGTCGRKHLNSLGRTHRSLADNLTSVYETKTELDVQGNELAVIDARGNRVLEQRFDMLSRVARSTSPDSGDSWAFVDVTGAPIAAWDSRGVVRRWRYDALRRPTHVYAGNELRLRTYYGETAANPQEQNLRARPYLVFDGAGLIRTALVDFKGNTLRSERRLTIDARSEADWSTLAEVTTPAAALAGAEPLLEDVTHTSATAYDALNRPVLLTAPDGSRIRPAYNEANLLDRIDVAVGTEWTPYVQDIDYNARGQRVLVELGSGVRTAYEYDAETFRLTALTSRAGNQALQALSYTYDVAGNIVAVEDGAQQTLFYANQVVTPDRRYEYDATYRLTKADGREHIGQTEPGQPGPEDPTRYRIPHANDLNAMRRYSESYEYDEVGNFLAMLHRVNGTVAWRRRYDVAPGSNRLLATSLPGDPDDRYSAPYSHDENGNITAMPHLRELEWSREDRLTRIDLGGGGTAYYQYDADGQRVRALTENGGNSEVRVYLGGTEIYRQLVGSRVQREERTLHVMDGNHRIALVERLTVEDGRKLQNPRPVSRYQLADHLHCSAVEVDANGTLLSYEEYHPYGTTSFHSDLGTTISKKRYRFTGKEKDTKTGLYYHGARYYAPWLARWTSCDPSGLADGPNVYAYVSANPVRLIDESGHFGEDAQKWLAQQKQLTQEVIATRKTRGFHPGLPKAIQNLWDAFGPGTKANTGHLEKPFWALRAGEGSKVGPEDAVENQERGRTIEKADAEAARAKGEYARKGGVDVEAEKGVRNQRPPLERWVEQFKNWTKPKESVPAPSTTPAPGPGASATPAPSAPQPEAPSKQLSLLPDDALKETGGASGGGGLKGAVKGAGAGPVMKKAIEAVKELAKDERGAMRGGLKHSTLAIGLLLTVKDVTAAVKESSDRKDWRPLAAEGVRQGLGWGGSMLLAPIGAAVGGLVGGEGGATGGVAGGPGGVVVGGVGGAGTGATVGSVVFGAIGGAAGTYLANKINNYLGWK